MRRKALLGYGVLVSFALAITLWLTIPTIRLQVYVILIPVAPQSFREWSFEQVRAMGPTAVPVVAALIEAEDFRHEVHPYLTSMNGHCYQPGDFERSLLEWIEEQGPAAHKVTPALLEAIGRSYRSVRQAMNDNGEQDHDRWDVEDSVDDVQSALDALGPAIQPYCIAALESKNHDLLRAALLAIRSHDDFLEDSEPGSIAIKLKAIEAIDAFDNRNDQPLFAELALTKVHKPFRYSNLFEGHLTEAYFDTLFNMLARRFESEQGLPVSYTDTEFFTALFPTKVDDNFRWLHELALRSATKLHALAPPSSQLRALCALVMAQNGKRDPALAEDLLTAARAPKNTYMIWAAALLITPFESVHTEALPLFLEAYLHEQHDSDPVRVFFRLLPVQVRQALLPELDSSHERRRERAVSILSEAGTFNDDVAEKFIIMLEARSDDEASWIREKMIKSFRAYATNPRCPPKLLKRIRSLLENVDQDPGESG